MGLEEKAVEVKQSFGLYDLFGYILPGFFFFSLIIIEYDCSKILNYISINHSLKDIETAKINYKFHYFLDFIYYNPTSSSGFITFLIFVLFCYLCGHIISAFSSALAKFTLKRFFRNPTENLFILRPVRNYKDKISKSKSWFSIIKIVVEILFYYSYSKVTNFLGVSINYRKPFEEKFRLVFEKQINSTFGYEVSPKDYYWIVTSYIHARHQSCSRVIKHFVNLAGFARNIAGAFLLYIILRIAAWHFLDTGLIKESKFILCIYFILSAIMVWSYMRLYKRQAVEMYYLFYSLIIK